MFSFLFFRFSMLPTVHIMACRGVIWAAVTKGLHKIVIAAISWLTALPYWELHPTPPPIQLSSCAIFATRGALSVSAQLASSDSLPCNLQDDFLELSLGKSIPTRRSSVNLVPKALSSSLHSSPSTMPPHHHPYITAKKCFVINFLIIAFVTRIATVTWL